VVRDAAWAGTGVSPADALCLAFYPLACAGLVLLLRRNVVGLPRSVLADGLIGGLGVAALGGGLVLEPILASAGADPMAVITALAYPLGDLMLIVLVVGAFALIGQRPGRAWALVGATLVLLSFADVISFSRIATGVATDGPVVAALWPLALLALAVAAWQVPTGRAPRPEGWAVFLIPGAAALAALGLLVFDHLGELSTGAMALAAATILAAGVRTGFTLHEVLSLHDSRRLALTDELTGLGNRRRLYSALAQLKRQPATLLLVDLDRFKELNDTLGHQAGDRLLEQIGERLQRLAEREWGAGTTLARLGGDEFAILLPSEADSSRGVIEAALVRETLQQPMVLRGITVRVEASVGIAVFPQDGATADTLLARADVAMYEAKRQHSGVEVYAPERDAHSRERLALFGELRQAIDDRQLVLHYQPQRDLRSGRVTMVEALVRWDHPQRGLLSPGEFIPLAEQTDLMRPLTLYVLNRALEQVGAWERSGISLGVAVNIAVANLLDAEFPAAVAAAVDRSGVPADRLQLEITENVVMADPVRAAQVLADLGRIGVRLSLDDFGTGYSSLAYLKQLPVEELKIDRSFVMGMAADGLDAAIVRSTIDLARNLGLQVVAEGVEDAATLADLEALGCDLAQGFYLSRPVPPAELEAWMRASAGPAGAPARPPVARPAWQAAVAGS
jgi:diguanylate cyclase (GGDEF)-like protein